MNANTHAVAHWKHIAAIALFVPISRFVTAIAATQGMYRSTNVRNESAAGVVSIVVTAALSAAAELEPVRTASVLTTVAFAVSPVTSAVESLQSLNPSGRNIGLMNEPIAASILCAASVTTLRRVSKLRRNQMTIVAPSMIVNALRRKSHAFCLMSSAMFFIDGMRYAGSSSTNGTGFPLNAVFFSSSAERIATTNPKMYRNIMTSAA